MSEPLSTTATLVPAEAVLVDILRMILRGRADDVPARVRKLVSTPSGRRSGKLSEPGRAAIALLLAEESARSGRTGHLRAQSARGRNGVRASAEPALDVEEPVGDERTPVLDEPERLVLERVIREHDERERLTASGLQPTRTILLSGAPGTGKSMTIRFLAARLGRPLMRVEPAHVIGSFLGESARTLSATFDRARERGAVLALDEIDALAKRRDDVYDVGEFKRFVSTLLVELDRWPGDAPLIAATNHLDLLDPALDRRFELHVRLSSPGEESRRAILEGALVEFGIRPDAKTVAVVVAITAGATGADLVGLAERAARRAVLDDELVERALLVSALPADPKTLDRRQRERFAAAARDEGHLSTRQIGELLGYSHTAARRLAQAGAATSGAGMTG